MRKINKTNAFTIILGIAILTMPFYIHNSYTLKIVCNVMLYSIIALSVNLIVGFCGQLDFGRAAFAGLGAYFSAIMFSKAGIPFFVAFIGGGLFAALCGALLGLLCRRTSFDYLTLITIGFNEIIRRILLNWQSVTNGAFGMSTQRPEIFGFAFNSHRSIFYFSLILLVISYVVIRRITHSKMGRAFKAIRDDEIAAPYAGIDVAKYKMLCFTVGSFFTGLAGAAMVHYTMFASPANYTTDESLIMLQMAILGGLGSLPGSIIGTMILVVFPEVSRTFYQYRLLFMGVLMVVLMLFAPNGLLGHHGIWDQIKLQFNKMQNAKTLKDGEING